MHAHPSWEVGGTMSQHGVQTNALVNREKLVPRGLIPLRETAAPCKAPPCPTCSALGGIRKQRDEWRSFSCNLPTCHLGSYAPVSTSVKRRGVLEITGSCDGRHLSTYKINKTYFRLSTGMPPSSQSWDCPAVAMQLTPYLPRQGSGIQRQRYELYHCRNGTPGRLHTQTKGSVEFCSQGCR